MLIYNSEELYVSSFVARSLTPSISSHLVVSDCDGYYAGKHAVEFPPRGYARAEYDQYFKDIINKN